MKEVLQLFRRGLAVLSNRGRSVLYFYGVSLTVLAGLDGVALYFVSRIFSAGIDGESIEITSGGATLALVVALFALRTVLSTAVSWVSVKQFALEEVRLGSHNFISLSNYSWNERVDSPVTDLYNGVDRGPNGMVQGLLITVVTIVAETASALLILSALLFLQPSTALIASAYFGLVAIMQHQLLSRSSSRAGEKVVQHTNVVYQTLVDAHSLAKLLSVNPSQSLSAYLEDHRTNLALARGRVIFLGMLPRYFMELILATGLALIAGGTYLLSGAEAAVAAVTVFAAAGFRLLPIVNRIQGLILLLFSTVPSARLGLIESPPRASTQPVVPENQYIIQLSHVSFRYPSGTKPVLSDINLNLSHGKQYAIVGSSGAGKTTLVDMCLGLLTPTSGEVRRTSTSLAYVPQDTHIAGLSLEQNIAMEWDNSLIISDKMKNVISAAQLDHLLKDRTTGGSLTAQSLSGGQKQRIGLARGLYREPGILFLDEVTSALDAETETAVMSSIENLRGQLTVVIVAHRLSTVQHADKVIYMENGRILGMGEFNELRQQLPQFQRQIDLGTLDLVD